MNSVDEELLRTALNDAVPYRSNPQRIDQIKHRVRIARRRRVLITTTTAAAAIAVAAVIAPTLLTAQRHTPVASSTLSWNPASVITPAFMQQVADSQYQGWQEMPGFPAKNGPKMVFFYESSQDASSGSLKVDESCSSDASANANANANANSGACSVTAQQLQELQPSEALVLYGPLSIDTNADDINSVLPVEKWCSQIGGTQELRAATAADPETLHGGYACLNNATPTVIDDTKQGLIVGYLPHSPYAFGSAS